MPAASGGVALNVMRAGDRLAPLGAAAQRRRRRDAGPARGGAARAVADRARARRSSPSTCWRRWSSPAGCAAACGAGTAAGAALLAGRLALAAGRAEAQAPADDAMPSRGQRDGARLCATGNARVDAISAAGLSGLSRALFDRTAIEPADPVAVDIEAHDISLYPVPLLADHRGAAAALGRGGGEDQRLPALRRHDPVRYPGRRPRRQRRAAPPRTAGCCSASRCSSTCRRWSRCRTTTC